MACGAIPERFPAFNAETQSRVAREKRELGLSAFLKNNTPYLSISQEIVDSFLPPQPAVGMHCIEPRIIAPPIASLAR